MHVLVNLKLIVETREPPSSSSAEPRTEDTGFNSAAYRDHALVSMKNLDGMQSLLAWLNKCAVANRIKHSAIRLLLTFRETSRNKLQSEMLLQTSPHGFHSRWQYPQSSPV